MSHSKQKRSIANSNLSPVKNAQWEKLPSDHFGYMNDAQRRTKRGLEEWEMVNDHSSNHASDFSNGRWTRITLIVSTVAIVLLYIYGVEINPPHTQEWFKGAYREEIFLAIFFCILLYTSMLFKLIFENKKEGTKLGEQRVLTAVLLGVVCAMILGVLQIFFGYLI